MYLCLILDKYILFDIIIPYFCKSFYKISIYNEELRFPSTLIMFKGFSYDTKSNKRTFKGILKVQNTLLLKYLLKGSSK